MNVTSIMLRQRPTVSQVNAANRTEFISEHLAAQFTYVTHINIAASLFTTFQIAPVLYKKQSCTKLSVVPV